jgi:hypothetical protein
MYFNQLIVKANRPQRYIAEIIAHVINVVPKECNIPLSIISQSDIDVTDALKGAQTELSNYWKRNIKGRQRILGRYQGKTESAFAFSGGKPSSNQGMAGKTGGYDI